MALNIKPATVRDKSVENLFPVEDWPDLYLRAGVPEGRSLEGYVRQSNEEWVQNFWKQTSNRHDYSADSITKAKFLNLIKGTLGVSRSKGSLKDMAKIYNDYKFTSDELNLYCNYAPLLNLETYGIKESCFLVINSELETERGLDNFIHLIPFVKNEDTYYEDNNVIGSVFDNIVRLLPKTEDYKLFRFKLAYKV